MGAVALIVATVVAFGSRLLRPSPFLLRYLTTHSIVIFVIYRVVLGVLVLGAHGRRDDQVSVHPLRGRARARSAFLSCSSLGSSAS